MGLQTPDWKICILAVSLSASLGGTTIITAPSERSPVPKATMAGTSRTTQQLGPPIAVSQVGVRALRLAMHVASRLLSLKEEAPCALKCFCELQARPGTALGQPGAQCPRRISAYGAHRRRPPTPRAGQERHVPAVQPRRAPAAGPGVQILPQQAWDCMTSPHAGHPRPQVGPCERASLLRGPLQPPVSCPLSLATSPTGLLCTCLASLRWKESLPA